MRTVILSSLMAVSAVALAACGTSDETELPDTSVDATEAYELLERSFDVINTSGNVIGTATIADQRVGGVVLTLDVTSIPEGEHAIHFHTKGLCDTPDFTSSQGHYNPLGHNHGFDADAPNPHAGDMRNFMAPASGVVQTEIVNERVTLADRAGFAPLFDADNTALIIHAGADDYVSQPTGDAGGRIACAVIAP